MPDRGRGQLGVVLELINQPVGGGGLIAGIGAYLKALRDILIYLGICNGNMEEGSFRCDANVSVRPKGQAAFGTRTEIKNLNSFRHVARALEHEILRQAAGRLRVNRFEIQEPSLNAIFIEKVGVSHD